MIPRLLALLPADPPDAYIGFWAIFGTLILFGLVLGGFPSGLGGMLAFWGRLLSGVGCLFVCAGLGYRRFQRRQ